MTYPDPRYHGHDGEISAVLRSADTPADLQTFGGGGAHYLATGATTHGDFGLYRWDMGPNAGGPATHFHRTISESFFVLDGEVRLYDGASWTTGRSGDFLYVPEGGRHAFRNDSDAPASILILFVPGAPREAYFEGLVEMFSSGREVSPEEYREFCERHDNYFVD